MSPSAKRIRDFSDAHTVLPRKSEDFDGVFFFPERENIGIFSKFIKNNFRQGIHLQTGSF